MFCGLAVCGVGMFMLKRAVHNAGFDSDLMQKNPGLAMTKMMAAINPDAQVVSTNDRAGTITIRDKSSGKLVTMKFDPDKKTMVVVGDDGKEVKISASDGSFTASSSDGTVKYGAGAEKAPSWVPIYPGATTTGTFSADSNDGSQNTFTFKTSDATSKVIAFYQEQLKSAGMNVTQMLNGDQGGLITGETAEKKRTITVTIGSSGEGTEGSIMAVEKK
jgi:hypothetical protein